MTRRSGPPATVECLTIGHVTVTASVSHRCPYRDERDHGTVIIRWTTAGSTIELHDLRAYLDNCHDATDSHEGFTAGIRAGLARLDGIGAVAVESHWTTAGMGVKCSTTRTPLAPESAPQ